MSWLSTDWKKFTAWLGSIESSASRAAASVAAASLSDGLTKTETALELIAVDAANAALALVPVVGPALTPTVDALLQAIACKILAKHSTPAAAAAALAIAGAAAAAPEAAAPALAAA